MAIPTIATIKFFRVKALFATTIDKLYDGSIDQREGKLMLKGLQNQPV